MPAPQHRPQPQRKRRLGLALVIVAGLLLAAVGPFSPPRPVRAVGGWWLGDAHTFNLTGFNGANANLQLPDNTSMGAVVVEATGGPWKRMNFGGNVVWNNHSDSFGSGTRCFEFTAGACAGVSLSAYGGTNSWTNFPYNGPATRHAGIQCNHGSCSAGFSVYPVLTWQVLPTDTPTATTPAGSGSGPNHLNDGNMELANPEAFWSLAGPRTGNGRHVASNYWDGYFGSGAYCDRGYQVLGTELWWLTIDPPDAMRQRFAWDGGEMYLTYSAMGDYVASWLTVELIDLQFGEIIPVVESRAYISQIWTRDTVITSDMPAGDYELRFAFHGPSPARYIRLDDVWLGHSVGSHCDPDQPTPTPTLTPTITQTPSVTPPGGGSGPTPTPYPITIFNCGFEIGSAGWTLSGGARIALDGGPSGPQYLYLPSPTSRASGRFQWPWTSDAYISFYAGPGSGEMVLRNLQTGVAYGLGFYSSFVVGQWQQHRVRRLLPAGTYEIAPRARTDAGWRLDGFAIARNGYVACNQGAPTPGPTAFVTPTATRTATAGPSPTGTSSAAPSATRTALPTSTPQPTYTPRATYTPQATYTQTGPEQTATAAGTDVATYTPIPSATAGGGPGSGGDTCEEDQLNCEVPDQPFPDCIRPLYFWEVAQWIDYQTCVVLRFFVWNDSNTQQVLDLEESLSQYEPFGSFAEFQSAREVLQAAIDEYDWQNTGLEDGTGLPDLLPDEVPGILTGDFNFDAPPPELDFNFLLICEIHVVNLFGQEVAKGACAAINWLRATGILGWTQFFFDVTVWLAFAAYMWRLLTVQLPQML